MEPSIKAKFTAIPWAKALIDDPEWEFSATTNRDPKPSGEDSFLAETLRTERTIKALATLKPVKDEEGPFPCQQIMSIIDLGDGLQGFPGLAHGGFIATLLDEVCGVLIVINCQMLEERAKKTGNGRTDRHPGYFTVYLNTTYKKPIPTPLVLVCKAKIEKIEGRKVWVYATIEDGEGTVFTIGEGMFIERKSRL